MAYLMAALSVVRINLISRGIMDLLSIVQALAGVALIVPGVFCLLHSKKKTAFSFKLGKGGLEVTGANAGMFLLLMGVLLLFLCRLNYQRAVVLKAAEAEKLELASRLRVSLVRSDSVALANRGLSRDLELALDRKAAVPDITGLTRELAVAAIRERGLNVGRVDTIGLGIAETALKGMGYSRADAGRFVSRAGDTVVLSSGAVIWQRLKPGQVARLGDRVAFTVIGR